MDLGILKGLKGTKITAEALYDVIAEAIEKKLLVAGDKLPSTRDIALYLGISRTTVMKSFETLIGRGYLTSSQGAGTWVTPLALVPKPDDQPIERLYGWRERYNDFARNLSLQGSEPIDACDFDEMNFGSASADMLPLSAWRKIMTRLSHTVGDTAFDANKEVFGYRPLREAISGFLRRSKGIICQPEQIVLASGVQTVISPVFTLLAKPGHLAVCENPGFYGAREQFHSLGVDIALAPVDEEGLVVDALASFERSPQWLYVAPSCQEPTGVTLSQSRRRSLLAWCKQHGTAILEDDWDSEFHYGGPSAPSLYTLDTTGSVIYFYSFWRLLYPLVSVGFLVIPEKLIEVFESYKNVWDRQFTLVEHLALTELLDDGHVETHVRSMWKVYRKRRQTLIFELTKAFGRTIEIFPSSTGMHVLIRFGDALDAEHIRRCATASGLACAATEPYYAHSPVKNEFMMRFSHLPPEDVEARVANFARALNAGA